MNFEKLLQSEEFSQIYLLMMLLFYNNILLNLLVNLCNLLRFNKIIRNCENISFNFEKTIQILG